MLLLHKSVPTFNPFSTRKWHPVLCKVRSQPLHLPHYQLSGCRTTAPLQALTHQSCASWPLLWSAESPHVHITNPIMTPRSALGLLYNSQHFICRAGHTTAAHAFSVSRVGGQNHPLLPCPTIHTRNDPLLLPGTGLRTANQFGQGNSGSEEATHTQS